MKTIAVIDDDIHIGNFLEELLQREGYAVLWGLLLFLHLLFISERGTIILRHNRIIIYVSVHFAFGKNAGFAFAFTWMFERLCRSNQSYAFFGAWLRLRTFFMHLLREIVVQLNYPVIKIKRRMYDYEKTIRIAFGSHAADAFCLHQHKQLNTD